MSEEKQFMVGDRVKINEGNFKAGEIGVIVIDDKSTCPFKVEFPGGVAYWYERSQVSAVEKTLATLINGDIILDSDGDEHKVLAVLADGIYLVSTYNDFDAAGDIMTAKELERDNYKVKDSTPEVVEMTVAEAAKKMGIDPSQLRIKD